MFSHVDRALLKGATDRRRDRRVATGKLTAAEADQRRRQLATAIAALDKLEDFTRDTHLVPAMERPHGQTPEYRYLPTERRMVRQMAQEHLDWLIAMRADLITLADALEDAALTTQLEALRA